MARGTAVFQEIPLGAGLETGGFVEEKSGGGVPPPHNDSVSPFDAKDSPGISRKKLPRGRTNSFLGRHRVDTDRAHFYCKARGTKKKATKKEQNVPGNVHLYFFNSCRNRD